MQLDAAEDKDPVPEFLTEKSDLMQAVHFLSHLISLFVINTPQYNKG